MNWGTKIYTWFYGNLVGQDEFGNIYYSNSKNFSDRNAKRWVIFNGIIEATKGSAAFWIDLTSCHFKDNRALHGGCPVLKGSKWILNKWINSFDQWKYWPCYMKPYATMRPFEGMSI